MPYQRHWFEYLYVYLAGATELDPSWAEVVDILLNPLPLPPRLSLNSCSDS